MLLFEQMKMFLIRFDFNSKVVVTGNPSQNDSKKMKFQDYYMEWDY